MNTCGSCGMCCKVMAISSLNKPAHTWCSSYVMRKGCGIYADRPQPCRDFVCLYIATPGMVEAWRPDKARFVVWMGTETRRLIVEAEPSQPGAWKREPYLSELRRLANRSQPNFMEIVIRTGRHVQMLFPEGEVDLGDERELPLESGYEPKPGGGFRPFARYVETPIA